MAEGEINIDNIIQRLLEGILFILHFMYYFGITIFSFYRQICTAVYDKEQNGSLNFQILKIKNSQLNEP